MKKACPPYSKESELIFESEYEGVLVWILADGKTVEEGEKNQTNLLANPNEQIKYLKMY